MDVTESNWQSKATENIDKFLHRGGNDKGNEAQFLGGTELQNTIGIAMGLPLTDPKHWSTIQLQEAEKGKLCFFDGTALQAINIIIDSIKRCCGGEAYIYITVVPIELYFKQKLYEIPVFKVNRYVDSKVYYVDNIGRYYSSFEDWTTNNKLPPCQIIYPKRLELKSNGRHTNVSPPYYTPSATTGNKVVEGLDIASGVIGITSVIGLMIISGPAAPFIAAAGVISAIWGTGRAISELTDRGTHGQSINPFTDETARMLWLGIVATISGFSAIGVTMRISALSARGIQISRALTIFTDSVSGISLTLNTSAIINNAVFIIQHINEMSPAEILLNVALIAFWTKGSFTYRRASVIIKQAQDQAFVGITKQLPHEAEAEITEVRSKVQNDASLLHLYEIAGKSNISSREFSQLLIDGMRYYENVAKLSTEQLEAFISLRNHLQDDLHLISGLQRFSQSLSLNRQDTLESVLSLWQKYTSNRTSRDDVRLAHGFLVMGNAPPIKITNLPQLTPQLIRFVGEHLTKIDTNTVEHWSIPELISFQDHGLFTICPVTGISKTGISTLVLNGEIQVSLRKLQSIPIDKCKTMLSMIAAVEPNTSSKLPSDLVKLCVRDLRLRFAVQRNESVQWAQGAVSQSNLKNIFKENLLPHEKDRLYTFKTEVNMKKADLYMNDMMNFVSEMKPKNVSELVAYSEFAMTYVDEVSANIEQSIRNGTIKLPHNTKKAAWLRQHAKEEAFGDLTAIKQKLNDFIKISNDNDMIGIQTLRAGLLDEELIAAVRSQRVRFGGSASAAYHIYKHSTDPVSAFVDKANSTIRSPSSNYNISIGQEGDSRIISFKDALGSAIVLEKDGRVLLATFRAEGSK